jgi:hypothetical protein
MSMPVPRQPSKQAHSQNVHTIARKQVADSKWHGSSRHWRSFGLDSLACVPLRQELCTQGASNQTSRHPWQTRIPLQHLPKAVRPQVSPALHCTCRFGTGVNGVRLTTKGTYFAGTHFCIRGTMFEPLSPVMPAAQIKPNALVAPSARCVRDEASRVPSTAVASGDPNEPRRMMLLQPAMPPCMRMTIVKG